MAVLPRHGLDDRSAFDSMIIRPARVARIARYFYAMNNPTQGAFWLQRIINTQGEVRGLEVAGRIFIQDTRTIGVGVRLLEQSARLGKIACRARSVTTSMPLEPPAVPLSMISTVSAIAPKLSKTLAIWLLSRQRLMLPLQLMPPLKPIQQTLTQCCSMAATHQPLQKIRHLKQPQLLRVRLWMPLTAPTVSSMCHSKYMPQRLQTPLIRLHKPLQQLVLRHLNQGPIQARALDKWAQP